MDYKQRNKEIVENNGPWGELSDGDHTFNDLYNHRAVLTAVLVEEIKTKYRCWKSWYHSDGSMFEDYFIVGIELPTGAVTYHYHKSLWIIFKCNEIDRAPEWDGASADDCYHRLIMYLALPQLERR